MTKRLKKYSTNMNSKAPVEEWTDPSGVACDEKKCKGEMIMSSPIKNHAELPNLRRAKCNICGWLGWV
jgi:hypothetical protein